MADEWIAVCETEGCGWQSEPFDENYPATAALVDHRSAERGHEGGVYDAAEVSA